MAKEMTVNNSADLEKCSDLLVDIINIMRSDLNTDIESCSSFDEFRFEFNPNAPEFFVLPVYRNQNASTVNRLSYFRKELASFLGYLSETVEAVEHVDIASDTTTLIENTTRFQVKFIICALFISFP